MQRVQIGQGVEQHCPMGEHDEAMGQQNSGGVAVNGRAWSRPSFATAYVSAF